MSAVQTAERAQQVRADAVDRRPAVPLAALTLDQRTLVVALPHAAEGLADTATGARAGRSVTGRAPRVEADATEGRRAG